ncbi:CBS domain-containing protein [Streptomyces globisporus]|uniref:CBS domain-containing protein n=1 Tax=Streptomyces globisporus TaxID=1908 RepID=UPI000AF0709B|nr:CBS domain-containing protein [Streptomyces globisporus]
MNSTHVTDRLPDLRDGMASAGLDMPPRSLVPVARPASRPPHGAGIRPSRTRASWDPRNGVGIPLSSQESHVTPIQAHPRTAHADLPAARTDTAEPHVWADMTVEVALAVMKGARTGRLIVRDDDGRRTGLVTQTQLIGFRATSAYTDRVQLRDLRPTSSPPRP